MDHNEVVAVGLDRTPEVAILLAAVLGRPGDDIGEHIDGGVIDLRALL